MSSDILVKGDGGYFVVKSGTNRFDYEINVDRCNDHEKLVKWIMQLSQKTWITPAHIVQLIWAFNDVTGLDIYGC